MQLLDASILLASPLQAHKVDHKTHVTAEVIASERMQGTHASVEKNHTPGD